MSVGDDTALVATTSDPVCEPTAVGVKVTVMVQLAPTAKLLPQVLACAKVPLLCRDPIVKLDVPGLLRVKVCGLLVVPSGWEPKVKEEGLSTA